MHKHALANASIHFLSLFLPAQTPSSLDLRSKRQPLVVKKEVGKEKMKKIIWFTKPPEAIHKLA